MTTLALLFSIFIVGFSFGILHFALSLKKSAIESYRDSVKKMNEAQDILRMTKKHEEVMKKQQAASKNSSQ